VSLRIADALASRVLTDQGLSPAHAGAPSVGHARSPPSTTTNASAAGLHPAAGPAARRVVHALQTKAEASRLIDRLRRRTPDSPADQRRELKAVRADLMNDRGGAARVRDDELEGYGSNCRWSHLVHDE
jgi:hypothetical protein